MRKAILDAARAYHKAGYVVFPCSLSEENGQKKPRFDKGWQDVKLDSCLQLFAKTNHNAIALKTGKDSDVIVLDLDKLKDKEIGKLLNGIDIICQKFEEHGDDILSHVNVRTGSAGRHIIFSLSKSMEAGLTAINNNAKLIIDGMSSSVDVRGEGGCIFAAPTKYGADKEYSMMSELIPSANLQAMPGWLIDILNNNGGKNRALLVKRKDVSNKELEVTEYKIPKVDRPAGTRIEDPYVAMWRRPPHTSTLARVTWQTADLLKTMRPHLESSLDNKIKSWYPKEYGADFHLQDKTRDCACCLEVHTSNGCTCNVVLPPCCVVCNYSPRCKPKLIGLEDVQVFKDIKLDPFSDAAFIQLFVEQQTYYGLRWAWFAEEGCFLKYNGTIYKRMRQEDIAQDIINICSVIVEQIVMTLAKQKVEMDVHKVEFPQALKEWLESFDKANKHLHKATSIDNIIKMAKYKLYDNSLKDKMDLDPNLLGCQNGIVDLRTGRLIIQDSSLFVSKQCAADFKGIDHPTPDIDEFVNSIFNGDFHMVAYMQKLLGYGITGLCQEERFIVFYGSGSNGKSVLNKLIKSVLGAYWGVMSRDCVFKSERPLSAGAASPHLALLKGLRISVLDDCSEDETLDDGTIKKMSSGVPMEARMLHRNPEIFTPTHLPIICTNHLPKINVIDEAIERRLELVPFVNSYKHPHQIDEDNPRHKPIDTSLGDKLQQPEALEQMLAWLVKGAVRWYQEGLGEQPMALRSAKDEYYEQFDEVGKFIREHCETGNTFAVSTSAFKQALSVQGVNKSAPDIKKTMEKKGFRYKKSNGSCRFLGVALVQSRQ